MSMAIDTDGRGGKTASSRTVIYRPHQEWRVGLPVLLLLVACLLWMPDEVIPGGLLVVPMAGWAFWVSRRRLVITRHRDQGILRVESKRWPFQSRVTVTPLDQISDVILEVGVLFDWRVALVMRSGDRVPLMERGSDAPKRIHERAVREIRALLGG
jgi:hypothetical protein